MQLAKQQIENIDVQKIQADVLKAQKEVQRKYIESGKMQQEVQRAMEQAKKSMEQANAELNEMKEFTGKLQQDGLIDKKKGYKIEWKDGGNLYINGELQSKEISEKYKKYYKKDGGKIICNGENTDTL